MRHAPLLFVTILTTAGFHGMAVVPDLSKLPSPAQQQGVTFDKDIKPLFATSCVRCHGEQKPKAGLRLDSLAGVLQGSRDGKVVVPGVSQKSQLVIAVARLDEGSAMPPRPRARRSGPGAGRAGGTPPGGGGDGEGGARVERGTNQPSGGAGRSAEPLAKPLTAAEVGLIRAWVDQGAR